MYGDAHGPVEIEFAQSCEEALSYLQQLAALHNAVWRARGQPGSFEREEFRAFHELAVRRLWSAQAVDLLRYYNEYFGVKYPLPKLDLIAVPGGFGGAMENWGGITFFESRLLFDPALSAATAKRGILDIKPKSRASRRALPKADVLPRLPPGSTIQSGGCQSR